MTVNYFLKIDGIAGESLDPKHKGEIELLAFSWGEQQVLPAGGGGSGGVGAGKAQIGDLNVTMVFNKASPALQLACASGQHLKSGVLTGQRMVKSVFDFLVYRFSDLLVSSYNTSGSHGDDTPIDSVAFNFGQIQVEYNLQRPDGALDSTVRTGWDLKANKKI